MRMARSRIDEEERMLIEVLDKNGLKLRNISLVSSPATVGDTDFDLIMTSADQQRWLSSTEVSLGSDGRTSDPRLRSRYHARYQRFMKLKYSDRAVTVLREYVRVAIPLIRDSELSFWSCSCLPSYTRTDITVYSRINIFWQEVFTVSARSQGPLCFSFHLALTPLEQRFGQGAERLQRRHPFTTIVDHHYHPGGRDQLELDVYGSRNALRLIHDPDIVRAIREFNLRLARKGPCTFSRYHCFGLADHLTE